MENKINNSKLNYIGITPGVGSALSFGWDKMKINFLYFFLIVIVLSIMDFPFQMLQYDPHHGWSDVPLLLGFFVFLYGFFFAPVIEYGADLIFLQGVRGQKIELKDLISGFNNYLNIILVNILLAGLIGISMMFLIIPGIIVAVRLAFVSYLIMDEGLNPIEAVETSWKITKGHGWKVFGLAFVSIFIVILGLICFIVGVIPAVMWIKASFAALYLSITGQKAEEETEVPEVRES